MSKEKLTAKQLSAMRSELQNKDRWSAQDHQRDDELFNRWKAAIAEELEAREGSG